jgi:hypothetical protein
MKTALLALFFMLLFLASCENPNGPVEKPTDMMELQEDTAFNGIKKSQCLQAGGKWNVCGSPCAGTGADFCIEVCQIQCQCGGIAGFTCPEGFNCRLHGKITDEIGVCA